MLMNGKWSSETTDIVNTFLRYYCYYIAVSLDGKKWRKVIDYRHISCYSYQILFFEQQVAQYIKLEGTHNTANPVSLEIQYI